MNCPVNEQTADGIRVGRCWFHLPDGKTCPRHGDVEEAVHLFELTGQLTLENDLENQRAAKARRRTG